MRILLFLLALNFLSVQSQDFKNAMMAEICDCIENNDSSENPKIENCYNASLINYAELLDETVTGQTNQEKFSNGQIARRKLLFAITQDLINTCDTYYIKIERKRIERLENLRRLSTPEYVQKTKESVAQYPIAATFTSRGLAYLGAGTLDLAEKDFRKALELQIQPNPMIQSYLALVLEEKGDYNGCLAILKNANRGEFDIENGIIQNIVRRKAKGNAPSLNLPETEEVVQTEMLNLKKESEISLNTMSRDSVRGIRSSRRRSSARATTTTETKKTTEEELKKLFKIDNK